MGKLELHLGVLPTDWFTVSNPETNRMPGLPPAVFRLLWRGGMLCVWLVLSEMLIGFSTFLMFSFVSTISAAAFSFYLPYVFELMSHGHEIGVVRKIIYALFIAISVFLSGAGVYSSAIQMKDNGVGAQLFAFSDTCLSGAFFVGRFDGQGYS